MDKTKISKITLFVAVFSGIIASSCCIGPAILALLGIAGAGIFAGFENIRPFFIAITLILLISAFYLTYRKREIKCEDGTCRIESAGKWNKIVLWLAAFIILLAILFPYSNFTTTINARVQHAGEVREVVIPFEGMTCTGCESSVEMAIKKVPGVMEVRADHLRGEVFIRFDSKKAKVDDFKKAINGAGYKTP